MNNTEFALKLDTVSCLYSNSDKETIKDLSFEIKKGSINAIIGGGESGKTTICDLVCGIIPKVKDAKVSGRILINGKSIDNLSLSELSIQIGKVAQEPESMFCNLYVKDEIAFGLENLCVEPYLINKKVHEILPKVGLTGLSDREVTNLSGGQMQRLAIASVLVMEPDILVLDEPTSNLDPKGIKKLFELLFELKSNGQTIILTSKEWYEEISLCDNLFLLQNGSILTKGDPNDLLNNFRDKLLALDFSIPQMSELFIRLNHKIKEIPSTIKQAQNIVQNHSINFAFPLNKTISTERSDKQLYRFENISYTYPDGTKALENLNFKFNEGQLSAVVGANGAGKSTLAKLMIGLIKPTSGKIFFSDQPFSVNDIQSKVGFVFQNPEHQFITDSVYDELAYNLKENNVIEKTIRDLVNRTLDEFLLKSDKDTHPFMLNPGKKRRLAVASILISEPKIVIIDEPTYGQDKNMTQLLMRIVRSLNKKGITIIMITHDMKLVEEHADRVYVLCKGEMIYEGLPRGLFINKDILTKSNLEPTQMFSFFSQFLNENIPVACIPKNIRQAFNIIKMNR